MRDRDLGRVLHGGDGSRTGEHGVAGPCFLETLAPEGAAKSIIKPSRAEPSRAEPSRAEPSPSCQPVAGMARLNRCGPRCPPDSLSFASRGAPPAPLPTEPPGTAPPPAPAAGARRLRRGRPGRSLSACIRRAAAALRLGGAPEPASAPAPAPGPSAAPGGRRFAFARTSRGVAVFVRTLALLAAVGAAVGAAHAQPAAYIEVWSATLTVGAAGRLRGYELGRYGALSEGTFTYAGREFQVGTLTFFRNEGLTNAPDDDYLSIILSVASTDPVGSDRYLTSLPFTYLYQIEDRGRPACLPRTRQRGPFHGWSPRGLPRAGRPRGGRYGHGEAVRSAGHRVDRHHFGPGTGQDLRPRRRGGGDGDVQRGGGRVRHPDADPRRRRHEHADARLRVGARAA